MTAKEAREKAEPIHAENEKNRISIEKAQEDAEYSSILKAIEDYTNLGKFEMSTGLVNVNIQAKLITLGYKVTVRKQADSDIRSIAQGHPERKETVISW